MVPENIALARRWFEEVWNLRRVETIDELLTAGSVCYTDDGPVRGPDEFKVRQFQPFVAAFPDLQVDVEDIIGQDDQVVVRWNAVGVHRGDGLGFKATLEPVRMRGMTWARIRDGKLHEGWQVSNIREVVQELAAKAPL